MDENEEFEFALAAEKERAAAASPAAAPPVKIAPTAEPEPDMSTPGGRLAMAASMPGKIAATGRDVLFAAPELLAEGVSHVGAKALSGLAGMAGASPDTMHSIQDALTYEPRTQTANAVKRGVGAATEAVSNLAPVKAVDKAVNDLPDGARTVVQGVEEAIPDVAALAGARMPGMPRGAVKPSGAVVEGAAKATQDDTLGALRAAGYRFRPSDVQAMKPGEKVPGLRRESLQEPSALKKDLTLHNSTVDNKLATEELGVKNLSAKSLDDAKKPHFEVYDQANEAANLAPSAEYKSALDSAQKRAGLDSNATVTESISALRRNARKRARSDDIKVNQEGEADLAAADALENELEKTLTAQGDEKLISAYRDSRQALAKIHDVETVTRGQQIDPQALRKLDKRSPGRLNGRLKLIADAADMASNVVKHPQKATGVRSSVKSEGVFSMVKDAARGAVSKLPGMDVSRPGFQAGAFGREATPAERSSFADYGRRPENIPRTPEPAPQLGAGNVDFSPTGGVTPSIAGDMAGDLALAPEPVPNAQPLPDAPSMLTADIIPPMRAEPPVLMPPRVPGQPPTVYPPTARDTIDFTPSMPQGAAMAEDFGFAPRPGDGAPYDLEWQPPSMASQMTGDQALALGLPDDLVSQFGLDVGTRQPSRMAPSSADPVAGPRVQLEAPAGRIGKAPGNLPPEPVEPSLAEQLGLMVDTPQPVVMPLEAPPGRIGKAPGNLTPEAVQNIAEQLGLMVDTQQPVVMPLEPPPGRVGKPPSAKKQPKPKGKK